MAASNKAQDEMISVDEITVSPRGRKKVIDPALAESLTKIKAVQALALKGTFGEVPASERPKVSQIIRKHWEHVRTDGCRINYSPTGVPQVSIKP
jgi:hypothetical protein